MLARLEKLLNWLATVHLTLLRVLLNERDPWFAASEPILTTSLTRTFLINQVLKASSGRTECFLKHAGEWYSRNRAFVSKFTQPSVQRHLLLIVSTG